MMLERNCLRVRYRRVAAIALAAMLQTGASVLPGAGLAHAAGAGPESCGAPAEVTEIAPGAFVRHGVTALPGPENKGAIANIGFIVGDESVAVIDTGGSFCDGHRLIEVIRKRTDLPVRYVIDTHVHPDHMFGNAAFEGSGAIIIAHHNLPRALAERGEHYLRSYGDQLGPAAMEGTTVVPPSKLVDDTMRIDLGHRPLTLTAHRAAHTDNDLTVYDETTAILWTGDLVFIDHIPVVDGSLKGWLAVTADLMKHPAKRIVPGHGPVVVSWPEAGEAQLRYLQRLADDLRRAIGAGESIREAAGEAAASESGRWQLFDSFNRRNATTGFAELEWE